MSSALTRVALAVVLSLLGGLVLAGLALPVVGGLGLIGKSVAEEIKPEEPPTVSLAQRSRILDVDGNVIATLFSENRVEVQLADVPQSARDALIAIEDSRFYDHRGIDVKGTLRALARNSSSGSVQQGGSTLTQQYAKNIRVEAANTAAAQEAAREQTLSRKLQEAKYALWLEEHLTKDEILEGYLNIAYYGSGVYGIGTAANHYFSIPVSKLTVAQGALLAGMVQSPTRFDPSRHPQAAIARRNTVLLRMEALGYLTRAERNQAVHEALALKVTTTKSGCEAPGVEAPFFCDYVRRYLEDGPVGEVLGKDRQARQERLLAGGLTIRTSLDPKVQRAAQQAVDEQVPAGDPFGAVAVADVVEPGTGLVKGMAVDRTFGDQPGETKVNFAIGGTLGFQGGSTFKAFVLARALQLGISPRLTLYAPQRYCSKEFKNGNEPYCVSNAGDSEAGTFDLVKATWDSVNTYFIQLEERTGDVTPPGLAEALGLRQVDGTFSGSPLERYPSFVLGTPTVSPLAMAAAYAAFPAHGQFCPPKPVVEILDSAGKPIALPDQPCSQVIEPAVADTVTEILTGVVERGTGVAAQIGRPAAGKTGTTNDSTAAWFVGYTPQLSTAVWVGKPTPTSMTRVTINGRYYKQVYGGSIPAPIWRQVMSGALEGVPAEAFTPVRLPSQPTRPAPGPAASPDASGTPAPSVAPTSTGAPAPTPKPKPTKEPKPTPTSAPPPTQPPSPPPSAAPQSKPTKSPRP